MFHFLLLLYFVYLGKSHLQNVVSLFFIGQWSRYGEPMEGNLIGSNQSNLFMEDDALEKMVKMFSFVGQWVLDVSTICKGTLNNFYVILLYWFTNKQITYRKNLRILKLVMIMVTKIMMMMMILIVNPR